MRDLALHLSGLLAIFVGAAHGILGERKVFRVARIEPPRAKSLVRLVWHCSAVAWMGGGVLLLVAPGLASDDARRWIIAVFVVVYAFAAAGNAWATRARHYGWMLLAGIVVLAVAGL